MVDKACFAKSMKILLLTVALFLIACKSDPPTAPEEPKPDPQALAAALKAHHAEQVKLLNRKHTLNKKLTKIVSKNQIDSSDEMKLVLAQQQQARLDLQKINTTHPSLKKLNSELSDWQRILGTARDNKRDFEITQANEQIIALNSKIYTLSKELPAIREAQDRIDRCDKELADLRRSFAEKTPEGQAIIQELTEIEKGLKAKQ